MSREFGGFIGGYFADKIKYAAADAHDGRDPLTRQWGRFLTEFENIAYAIASSEASDSGPEYAIMETIKSLPVLKSILDGIEGEMRVYSDVADEAIRQFMEKKK